jgi:RpiR family transcriptional regulator, carbohydrate utilization regulator
MTQDCEIQPAEATKGTCLSRIQSMAATSKNTAAAISEFVLRQPGGVVRMTLAELAERVGTSVASISRYCNLLGYENYRAFQIDLTASLAGNLSPVSDLFSPGDDPDTLIKRVFEMNRQGLADTEALLNRECLIEVARLIMDSSRLCLVGIGGSGLVARSGALRLASLGITALAITDPYEGLLTLSSSSAKDVVIAISHTGRSQLVLDLLDLARAKGARTVALTNYSDSVLAGRCEFALITSFRERRINAAVSSSSIEQLCMLDAIYFLIAHFRGPRAERTVLEIESNAERIIRSKS